MRLYQQVVVLVLIILFDQWYETQVDEYVPIFHEQIYLNFT
jgi:hypothetical protein